MNTKFKIGDHVYQATFGVTKKEITCLECFGKLFLTVILGDGERVTIDCAGCGRGFKPPTGTMTLWEHLPKAEMCKVTGMEINQSRVKYTIEKDAIDDQGKWFCYHTSEDEDKLFEVKEMAERCADQMAKEWAESEKERLAKQKHNHKHTWSWNAHYHRDCIRKAEKDLIYHRAKLEVAKVKAKEDKIQKSA